MSLIDKINIIVRNAARACAFECAKKMPKEFSMFVLAARETEAGKIFLGTWPDTWPDHEDDSINETMWLALDFYFDQYDPESSLTEDESVMQKQFIKFYNTVFKQGRNIASIFDNHFGPVETMMRDIARATGGKKTEVSDAPYTEDFYDGVSNTYMEFAKQVFKYLN